MFRRPSRHAFVFVLLLLLNFLALPSRVALSQEMDDRLKEIDAYAR
jgi:hypothetical protein